MRRGQAALEYLSTYGYAFLAILLTLGALTYFGVFDLSSIRSRECSMPPGVYCHDYVISDEIHSEPALFMLLLNSYGVELNVTSVRYEIPGMFNESDELVQGPCEDYTDGLNSNYGPVTWPEEGIINLTCVIDTYSYSESHFYEMIVRINVSQPGQSYTHQLTGTIAGPGQ